MKIIIAGAGEVGFHLAKLLSYESQNITLIDTNKESLAYADSHLDIRVLKGDATSIALLKGCTSRRLRFGYRGNFIGNHQYYPLYVGQTIGK